MSYIVKTSFYEGNTLHLHGETFEHTDSEYIQKCLNDGNIEEVAGAQPQPPVEPTTPPAEPTPQPPVEDQIQNDLDIN